MAGPSSYYNTGLSVNQCWGDSGARGNFALDSAAVHGTSGDEIAFRYQPTTSSPVAKVLFFIDDFAGTAANVSIRCRCYNEGATTSRAGTTLRATASTVTLPASADKWGQATFGTTYAHGVGEVLWFVLDNTAAAPTVDYPSILTATAILQGVSAQRIRHANGYTSTAGFSANGTVVTHLVAVFVHEDGNTFGQPFTRASATYFSSGTYERGIVITPPTRIVASGIAADVGLVALTAVNGFKIYNSEVAAGGTPLLSAALGSDANETTDELQLFKAFDTHLTLHPETTYYGVFTFASATQIPSVLEIEDFATYSTIFDDCFDDFGLCRSVYDNGGTWTPSYAATVRMSLVIDSFADMTAGVTGIASLVLQKRGDVWTKPTAAGQLVYVDIDYQTYDEGGTTKACIELPAGLNMTLETVLSYHNDSAVSGTIDLRIVHAPWKIDALRGACLTLPTNESRYVELRDDISDAYPVPLTTVGPCWLYIETSGGTATTGKLRIIGRPL